MSVVEQVERVSRLSVVDFQERFLSQNPVIVTGVMAGWSAMNWTVGDLRNCFHSAKVPLRMTDEEFAAFCQATGDSVFRDSRESRGLAIKGGRLWIVQLNAYFDAYLRGDDLARHLPYIMDIPMLRGVMMPLLRVLGIDSAEDWEPLMLAFHSLLGGVEFPEYLSGELDYRFWFAPAARPRGNLHADAYHNLNAQILGRKEWILAPPGETDTQKFTCTSKRGEILYIPKSWWHAASPLETCINVNAWHHAV